MTYTRPRYLSNTGNLAVQADEAWEGLIGWSDWLESNNDPPGVLVKDGILVRMTERGLEPYSRDSLRDAISRACNFGTQDVSVNPPLWKPKYPPAEVVGAVLSRDSAEYVDAKRVTHVVDVPILANDGSLIAEPGPHPSGVWFRPFSDDMISRSDVEIDDVDELVQARAFLLHDVLGDFEFVDESSKANALALLILPFVREMISGPTPLHFVGAPDAGAGKTTLVNVALMGGCGPLGTMSEPRNDEELRKLITSRLISGRHLTFDNLSQKLASGTLAAALTARIWDDRILGKNADVSLPIRCIWTLTGNNLNISSELLQRSCPILLASRDVPARQRPESSFKHPKIEQWALDNRMAIAKAALILVSHWARGSAALMPDGSFIRDDDGRRVRPDATLGSFGEWADVVGGVLAAADVKGFLENVKEIAAEIDPDAADTYEFLRFWREHTKGRATSSKELGGLCQFGGPLHDVLPLGIDTRDILRSLRYWLRNNRNQSFNGLQIVNLKPGQGSAGQWVVRQK